MIKCNNEWGKLKETIVGTVENANMPKHGIDLHSINYADKKEIPKNELGSFDSKVYNETYEDLESLVGLLKDAGVKVRRLSLINTENIESNFKFNANGNEGVQKNNYGYVFTSGPDTWHGLEKKEIKLNL